MSEPIPEPTGDVIVRDRDGDVWSRMDDGIWACSPWWRAMPWETVRDGYAPLTVYRPAPTRDEIAEALAAAYVPDWFLVTEHDLAAADAVLALYERRDQ